MTHVRAHATINLAMAAALVATPWISNLLAERGFRQAAEAIVARVPADKIWPMKAEALAVQLKERDAACAIRGEDGTLQPLAVSAFDWRFRTLERTHALAAKLPGYVPQAESANGFPSSEVMCQSSQWPGTPRIPALSNVVSRLFPLSLWTGKGANQPASRSLAFYSPGALASTLYRVKSDFLQALDAYHEHTHHLFNIHNTDKRKEFTFKGDAAFSFMLDEANAQTREIVAAYVMKLRGEPRYWEAADRWEQKAYIEKTVSMYDAKSLAAYAKETGALPPLLTQLIFTYTAGRLVTFDSTNATLKKTMDTNPGSQGTTGLGLKDDYIARALAHHDNSFANAPDLTLYLWRHSPIGYTDFDAGLKALKEKDPEKDYRLLIRELGTFFGTSSKDKSQAQLREILLGTFNTLQKDGELDYRFALSAIAETRKFYTPLLTQTASFSDRDIALRRAILAEFDGLLKAQFEKLCRERPRAPQNAPGTAAACVLG